MSQNQDDQRQDRLDQEDRHDRQVRDSADREDRLEDARLARRQVSIERWQVVGAFLLLVVVFTTIVVWQDQTAHRAARNSKLATAAAAQSARLVAELRRVNEDVRNVRSQQVAQLHAQQVSSCAERHVLTEVLRKGISRGITQTRIDLNGPIVRLPGVRKVELANIRISQQLLRDLKHSDCLGLAPLPKTPKAPTTTSP